MPVSLRQTLEKAELELLSNFRAHLAALTDDHLRDVLAELVEFEEVEDDEETGEKHPLRELQEFGTTWLQLDNLMEQVRAQLPEDDDGDDASEAAASDATGGSTPSGKKPKKQHYCCEFGKREAEEAATPAVGGIHLASGGHTCEH